MHIPESMAGQMELAYRSVAGTLALPQVKFEVAVVVRLDA